MPYRPLIGEETGRPRIGSVIITRLVGQVNVEEFIDSVDILVERIIGYVYREDLVGHVYQGGLIGILDFSNFSIPIYVRPIGEVFSTVILSNIINTMEYVEARKQVEEIVGRIITNTNEIGQVYAEGFIGKVNLESTIGFVNTDFLVGRIGIEFLISQVYNTRVGEVVVLSQIGLVNLDKFIGLLNLESLINKVIIQ